MTRKQINFLTWVLILGTLALAAILGQCVGGA